MGDEHGCSHLTIGDEHVVQVLFSWNATTAHESRHALCIVLKVRVLFDEPLQTLHLNTPSFLSTLKLMPLQDTETHFIRVAYIDVMSKCITRRGNEGATAYLARNGHDRFEQIKDYLANNYLSLHRLRMRPTAAPSSWSPPG